MESTNSENRTATVFRADRLRILRERKGWSQRELAIRSNIGEGQVFKYENGQSDPYGKTLKLLADCLGVSTDYLLGRTDEPQAEYGGEKLTEEETRLLQTFRREGWSGVTHLIAEQLPK